MANCLLWYNRSILKVRIFYCKKPKNAVFFCLPYSGTWVHKRVRVKLKVPEYGSRFPSTGLSSQVRINYKQLQYIKVPEYGLKFPSTGQGSQVRILEKIWENHQFFKSLKNNFNL
jgi:hypothetical protein